MHFSSEKVTTGKGYALADEVGQNPKLIVLTQTLYLGSFDDQLFVATLSRAGN